MDNTQTILLLMFVAVILVGIATKIKIPYPIALVLGGIVIGFIPSLQPIDFDPNLILVIVLPPILYYSAYGISFQEFKKNWHEIFSLALGLVVFTTLVIGLIFKWIFPEFPWALAFTFGAIVSPPDASAATTILKRFNICPRLLTILEGESLINDASAIVLYKLAVTALLSGAFSLPDASFEFFKITSGGVLVGFILGIIIQQFSRFYLEPVVGVVFSFTIPYFTYIIASSLGVSGVLAVVVSGLIGSKLIHKHHSSLRRILGFATWDIYIILLNCFIFILIGLQLRTLTKTMSTYQFMLYFGYALFITLAMIVVRVAWVYSRNIFTHLKTIIKPKVYTEPPKTFEEAAIVGWSGMRGIVSLTAALALPVTLDNGMPIEGRNEVIFITFCVILLTLLIPGFTLPTLSRWLKIQYHTEMYEANKIRKQLVEIAEKKIEELHKLQTITIEELNFLKRYFNVQRRLLQIASSKHKKFQNLEQARLQVIQEQRKHLLATWDKIEIDDNLLIHLENELDMEEASMTRAEL